MKFTRKGSANWQGNGKDGKGTVSTESGVLDKTKYSAKSRFEDEKGTNPEELIAASHAGCFSMKLSFVLAENGFTADNLDTEAVLTFEDGSITRIVLNLKGKVSGIDETEFRKHAENAKENCPVSKLLNAEILLNASLEARD